MMLPHSRTLETIYHVAGRIMAKRDFGKAAFVQLQDRTGRLQVYVAKNLVGEESFELFRKFDLGDIVGVKGAPFAPKPMNSPCVPSRFSF